MKPGQLARLSSGRSPIASGKLRVLAVATATRAYAMRDRPTVAEAGLVPVLVDGGQALTESRIINEYLEDAYARARMRL